MKKLHYKANTDIGVQFYESVFRDYGDNYVIEVPFANQLVYLNDDQKYIEEGCYAPRDFLAAIKGCCGVLEMEVLFYTYIYCIRWSNCMYTMCTKRIFLVLTAVF